MSNFVLSNISEQSTEEDVYAELVKCGFAAEICKTLKGLMYRT